MKDNGFDDGGINLKLVTQNIKKKWQDWFMGKMKFSLV